MIRRLKNLTEVKTQVWLMIISGLPGEIGFKLRYKFWEKRLKYLGKNVRIDTGVYFQNPSYIAIDDNSWIDKNAIILAGLDSSNREKIFIKNEDYKGEPGVVYIGKNNHVGLNCIISGISAGVYIADDCSFSAHCKIYAFTHHYRSKNDPKKIVSFGTMASNPQCLMEGSIQIGNNNGVALNSVILPGVFIPNNCFVALNSVVYPRKYTSNSILSGNPATKVENRFILQE